MINWLMSVFCNRRYEPNLFCEYWERDKLKATEKDKNKQGKIEVYIAFDDGDYGVFGKNSNICYILKGTKKEAEKYIREISNFKLVKHLTETPDEY